eukprot:Awhi_evm1s3069
MTPLLPLRKSVNSSDKPRFFLVTFAFLLILLIYTCFLTLSSYSAINLTSNNYFVNQKSKCKNDKSNQKISYIPSLLPKVSLDSASSVLITGAGGFIGFSLANQIKSGTKTKKTNVVGVDLFNDYYDVQLKRDRAKFLKDNHDVDVLEGDVCDVALLERLFEEHKFTHIVHLAAQAGVRYSLEKPLQYVRENVECYTVLMDFIAKREEKQPHIVYASSSSVYGMNKEVPFAEHHVVNKPASIYAASKIMDELIAETYYKLYDIKSIGLRFFTVYGPFGRPDMACFQFVDKILKGEPITVFNDGKLERDFTYVTDIVSGIMAAMEFTATQPEIFNLGNGSPVPVLDFVKVIEKVLNKNAIIEYKDQRTEVPITFADTTKAEILLGYKSTVDVQTGTENYIKWFLEYYTQRE